MIWGRVWLVFAMVLILALPSPGSSASAMGPRVVLLHHTGDDVVRAGLYNLLAHFSQDIVLINVDVQDIAALAKANAPYIVHLGDTPLPVQWQQALRQTTASLYFMGGDPKQLFPDLPFDQQGTIHSATTLDVKGKKYALDVALEMKRIIPAPDAANLFATVMADNGSQSSPYILAVQREQAPHRIYYCTAFTPFGDLSYAIADSLFDFFQKKAVPRHEVYIRIEDVHPMRDPNELRNIIRYLGSQHIPYMIAVIPIYKSADTFVTLESSPALVGVLREAQNSGGTLIMHGVTHQYYDTETGEGYEFWDSQNKAPIPDEESYIENKVRMGLQIFLKNHLYPAAFEPPHYAMTQHGYEVIHRTFSTVVGNIQLSDHAFITQTAPYSVSKSYQGGVTFYPETGDYAEEATPVVLSKMLANVRRASIARESQSGLFFHPFLPLSMLQELVDGLHEQEDMQFFDLRRHANTVQTPWGTVWTNASDGTLHTDLHGIESIPAIATQSQVQTVSNWVAWSIVIVVLAVIVVFVIQVRLLRRRRAMRLFPELREEGGKRR
ncbi:MAG: DUF2334 domain-containing protein [Tumebacillaceae bacterium]